MTAAGKITTARLVPGKTRIMVEILSSDGKAFPSRTKRKNAVPVTVLEVTTVPSPGKWRQAGYRVVTRADNGRELIIGWSSGAQTYWLA